MDKKEGEDAEVQPDPHDGGSMRGSSTATAFGASSLGTGGGATGCDIVAATGLRLSGPSDLESDYSYRYVGIRSAHYDAAGFFIPSSLERQHPLVSCLSI